MKDMVSATAVRELIEQLKCQSSNEEQMADVWERVADGKREYVKALDSCVEQLEALIE